MKFTYILLIALLALALHLAWVGILAPALASGSPGAGGGVVHSLAGSKRGIASGTNEAIAGREPGVSPGDVYSIAGSNTIRAGQEGN